MNNLQGITEEAARALIKEHSNKNTYNLQYYSWPQMFSNTAGPFSKEGIISGQAFTQFQMECWTDGEKAVIFSGGKLVKLFNCEQPFTVDWYLSQRGNW